MVKSSEADPAFQPIPSLQIFNRSINGFNIADGSVVVTADYDTTGPASATHTEPFVPLPTSSMMPSSAGMQNQTETGLPKPPPHY